MQPEIAARPEGHGVRITDPIEQVHEELHTPAPVDPDPCSTDAFYFPVDTAAAIETARLSTPYPTDVWVRTPTGDLVADTTTQIHVSVPAAEYNIELSIAGVKLYLAVESPVNITATGSETQLQFDEEHRIEIGARSHHEQPAGRITVPSNPEGVMRGLSLFGSALKTMSPERSFPTLRGHPPVLELGDSFDNPTDLCEPETDVRIEVPPTWENIFPVATLAYYLGASVRPGPDPLLIAGDQTHHLDGDPGFEETVTRILKQTFLFDCVTRTEGIYEFALAQREQLESTLDETFDFAWLYDQPLADRVNRYLDVSYDRIADVIPTWRVTADIDPEPARSTALPYVADRLAVIRCDIAYPPVSRTSQPGYLGDFYRRPDPGDTEHPARVDGGVVEDGPGDPAPLNVVRPRPADSLEHLWLADGIPQGASKASTRVFERQIARSPDDSPGISVTVVCNDPAMSDENVVSDVYGDRRHVAVDVTTARDTTRDELQDILASDTDFLHYIGHIDQNGLQCQDGHLDARTLTSIGADAFLLNGCRSYEQGQALVERGAIAGMVTLNFIGNEGATQVGRRVAEVLNGGHSLSTAASLVERATPSGFSYNIIGDGTIQIIRTPGGTPIVADLTAIGDDTWDVELTCYPSGQFDLGSHYRPNFDDAHLWYLSVGSIGPFTVSTPELQHFLDAWSFPVWKDGDLRLSTRCSLAESQ